MIPHAHILTRLDSLALPHRGGHRCTDGAWYNPGITGRVPCPFLTDVRFIQDDVTGLAATLNVSAATPALLQEVVLAMTGLDVTTLDPESAAGWIRAAQMALIGLDHALGEDPAPCPG